MKVLLPLLALLVCCAGCTSASVRTAPGIDLNRYQRVFVQRPFNENRHVDEMIVDELRALGREASSGPLTMMPENTEILLAYSAHWSGDFKTYLIGLNVSLYTAHSRKQLAEGSYSQPNPRPRPPEKVVHNLFARLFAKR